MTTPQARKGQAPDPLTPQAFGQRFRQRFADPAFDAQLDALARLEQIRWEACDGGHTDPTRTAGKDANKAKQIELDGWHYPKHLAGRSPRDT